MALILFRYFLFTTSYFLYGESLIYYFKPYVFADALFLVLAKRHRFISFVLYVIGIVVFSVESRVALPLNSWKYHRHCHVCIEFAKGLLHAAV